MMAPPSAMNLRQAGSTGIAPDQSCWWQSARTHRLVAVNRRLGGRNARPDRHCRARPGAASEATADNSSRYSNDQYSCPRKADSRRWRRNRHLRGQTPRETPPANETGGIGCLPSRRAWPRPLRAFCTCVPSEPVKALSISASCVSSPAPWACPRRRRPRSQHRQWYGPAPACPSTARCLSFLEYALRCHRAQL